MPPDAARTPRSSGRRTIPTTRIRTGGPAGLPGLPPEKPILICGSVYDAATRSLPTPRCSCAAKPSPIVASSGAAGLAKRPLTRRARSTTVPSAPSTGAAIRERVVVADGQREALHLRDRRDTRRPPERVQLSRRGEADRDLDVRRATPFVEALERGVASARAGRSCEHDGADRAYQQRQRDGAPPPAPELEAREHPDGGHASFDPERPPLTRRTGSPSLGVVATACVRRPRRRRSGTPPCAASGARSTRRSHGSRCAGGRTSRG